MKKLPSVFSLLAIAGLASAAAAGTEFNLPTSLEFNSTEAIAEPTAATPAATPATTTTATKKAPAACTTERMNNDPEIGWKGFLSGLRGFEGFHAPVGSPIYFESPIVDTEIRPIYMYHSFPQGNALNGGQVNVYALQARVAITDRLGFIATKDGYSVMNNGLTPDASGWNDIAAGLKYAFWVDEPNQFVMSGGVRYEMANGSEDVLQRGVQEWSPFFSLGKSWGDFHFLAGLTYRIPEQPTKGNSILHWDLHADWDIAKDALPGFAPVLEFHGIHYLTNGDFLPLNIGGVDYNNLGSNDVSGHYTVTVGMGYRWRLSPHVSLGGLFELPLTTPGNDIFLNRLTFDVVFSY